MNDVLQTLPQLVYIIPFIYLMPVSYVPGIVAGVLYAFPVVVRLVERGVRDVAPDSVEAASAFGGTRRQVLAKVKVPLAGDAIMLGVNQGIIMVLAVVVIGGLVGSGGLGYLVAQGPATRRVRTRAWWRRSRSSLWESRSTASHKRHEQHGRRVSSEEEIDREGGFDVYMVSEPGSRCSSACRLRRCSASSCRGARWAPEPSRAEPSP